MWLGVGGGRVEILSSVASQVFTEQMTFEEKSEEEREYARDLRVERAFQIEGITCAFFRQLSLLVLL